MSDNGPKNSSSEQRDVCAPRSTPNSAWVCGYAEIGKCCAIGPTSNGCCGLTASASSLESAATEGELTPCIPRRSYQWRSRSLCLNLAILTGGILLLCMALPSRERTFVPGGLSGKHAQILDNTLESQRCGLCHPNSHVGDQLEPSVAKALASGFLGNSGSGNKGTQDALCMQCHQGHMPGALQRTPHDLSTEMLQALAGEDRATEWHTIANRTSNTADSDPHHKELAHTNCADCHIEHHGRGFDLKAMADDRCQACHRRKFESFTSGHPEFKNFPAERPRAFAFSHQVHANKHFPQKNRDFDCRQCHLGSSGTANAGAITRSVSFETACAECHQEPIRAATAVGWAVLQLPSIDATAGGQGSELEHWPAEARFGFEGTISPVLRALLEADEAAREALAQLPPSGELSEISDLSGQRQRATESLALATERLIRETARDGQAAWRERLSKVVRAREGRELNAEETALIEAMCAGLPPDLFRQMQAAWFDDNKGLADSERPAAVEEPIAAAARSPASETLKKVASPLVLTESGRGQPARLQGIIVERKKSGLLVSDESRSEPPADELVTREDGLLLEESTAASSDLLLPDSSNSNLLDTALPESEAASLDLLDSAIGGSAQSQPVPVAKPLAGASHLAAGGWFLDRETLALRYMPTGHGDKTLAAWNMWCSRLGDTSAKSLSQPIPGGCLQCHQLGSSARAVPAESWSAMAAWRLPQRPLGQKEFTHFDHGPHLSLPAVNDCRYCHTYRDASPIASPPRDNAHYSDTHYSDTHSLSEFREMQLAQCVACHRPTGANSGCLQCHNYHVTTPPKLP